MTDRKYFCKGCSNAFSENPCILQCPSIDGLDPIMPYLCPFARSGANDANWREVKEEPQPTSTDTLTHCKHGCLWGNACQQCGRGDGLLSATSTNSAIKWTTPAEALPDPERQTIVAWDDGQVTYNNYSHAINWDHAQYWSYMPEHPVLKISN